MGYYFGASQKNDTVPVAPIVPILEHYGAENLDDTEHGWFKVRCPFHNETHASASYRTDKQVFNCFACGVSGDAYKLVQNQESVTFPEALTIVGAITGNNALGDTEPKATPVRVNPSNILRGNTPNKGTRTPRKRTRTRRRYKL